MNADGGDATQLTSGPRVEFAPTFSPNGRRIAFNRQGNDDRIGLWVMRADGSNKMQKTFGKFDFFPDWQPI
jgi:TolB protein